MSAEAKDHQLDVWTGLAEVAPQEGCELLGSGKGAFMNVLTLARSEAEYRLKVVGAMSHYRLKVLAIEKVEPFSLAESSRISDELRQIADDLTDPTHVRFTTMHTDTRLM